MNSEISASGRSPRVLVRTLPFSSGNYGGILQGYALQRVLEQMGASVETDISIRKSIPGRVRAIFNGAPKVDHQSGDAGIDRFVAQRINTVRIFDDRSNFLLSDLTRYDYFVSGSDQVFRPHYANVSSYLFDFLTDEQASRAFTYAASFGLASAEEFSLVARFGARRAAHRLRGISVREQSGVQVAESLWGLRPARHIDPTLLLDEGQYREIFTDSFCGSRTQSEPTLVTYLLDSVDEPAAPSRSKLPDRIVELGEPLVPIIDGVEEPRGRKTIECWLCAIADAAFVVTDSFHGCVFSLIFRRPFIVLDNPRRGSSRISDLLNLFSLSGLLFERTDIETALAALRLAEGQIDWEAVGLVLANERRASISYLRAMLNSA